MRVHKFNYQKRWFREDSGLAYQEGVVGAGVGDTRWAFQSVGIVAKHAGQRLFRGEVWALPCFFLRTAGELCVRWLAWCEMVWYTMLYNDAAVA